MFNHDRKISERSLLQFAAVIARCEADASDELAWESLARMANANCRDFPELTERALAVLAQDDRSVLRKKASAALRTLLHRLDDTSRSRVVSEWAGSTSRRLRAALARALCSRVPIAGVIDALERLSRDQYADVRRAACVASARRTVDGGDPFAAIVRSGTCDARRSVRLLAITALEVTAARTPNPEPSIEALHACTRSRRTKTVRRARRALRRLGSGEVVR